MFHVLHILSRNDLTRIESMMLFQFSEMKNSFTLFYIQALTFQGGKR